MILFKDLPGIIGGKFQLSCNPEQPIIHLLIDSRKITPTRDSIFIAIEGTRHDGHTFIPSLIEAGVKQFIVNKPLYLTDDPRDLNVLVVEDSLSALQGLARFKRNLYSIPVIGITGSNGKTIVKEWLGQLLAPYYSLIKSPGSYNSQVGVPLSVWGMDDRHTLAIFEAGISKPGEMANLQSIIRPTLGIFTSIGAAHDEGFDSMDQKIKEKAVLFKEVDKVIYCKDHADIDAQLLNKGFTWGYHEGSDVRIDRISHHAESSTCYLEYRDTVLVFTLPFTTKASLDNVLHCITLMLFLGYEEARIQKGIEGLKTVPMRLELKRGLNGSLLIDDTYNNDLAGLKVALDFLISQRQLSKKSIIISDLLQTGMEKEVLYRLVLDQLMAVKPERVLAVGPEVSQCLTHVKNVKTFVSTDELLKTYDFSQLDRELVLIKGARPFAFERIVKRLEEKIHGTHLEIDLDALTHNLNFYRSKLRPGCKLMVMVKAFAYGSGALEIANLLQYHKVDYLGVAYADEGVFLRNNGIHLPIMVMNPTEESFDKLIEHSLEPELYNLSILRKFVEYAEDKKVAFHLKLETGMHRLGFSEDELTDVSALLREHKNLCVKSIFSHLAGSDDPIHNEYSRSQAMKFEQMSQLLINELGQNPLRHLVNSSGILRFPEYHYDMVRLGIGLYGVESNQSEQDQLEPISSLKTIISQLSELKPGETIGYGRKGLAEGPSVIATLAIGYADGYSRAFSNGVGHVWINGHKAPVIGSVCMDMTMVDVTGIPNVKEGDEVEIFGKNLSLSEVAACINTIPYEILTLVDQRVKRVYFST